MKLLLIALLIVVPGCKSSKSSAPGTIPEPVDTPTIETESPQTPDVITPEPSVPAEPTINWDANLYFVNFTSTQKNKVEDAVDLMRKVIASEAFKSAILDHTYGGKKTFVDNGGKTNLQIYNTILDGAEIVGDLTKNGEMDAELELYYAGTSTVGYTYPTTTRIWMNTKFFNTYTTADVARNLMHEWTHKLGFTHASSYSTSRDYSVPYAVGEIMESLAKKVDSL